MNVSARLAKLEAYYADDINEIAPFDLNESELFERAENLHTIEHYKEFFSKLNLCHEDEIKAIARHLCRIDLFFLLTYGLNRKDMLHPWLLDRCREVQANPNGYLDLWAREHYKSTIITYGLSIQDILSSHGDDPHPKWNGREVTLAIFSCTRPIAKGFLRQIKREFEANDNLRSWFSDVLWENPHRDAPKWSEDDGLVVKRKSNPKESTLEAWGVVDGQPTSKHFLGRVYDDIVTVGSVTSPEMINKVTATWEISTNLGTEGGYERYIGTRYHFNDTYRVLIARGTVKLRLYTPFDDGTLEGKPVLKSAEELAKKRRDQGPYTFACQMMQNPKADEKHGFKTEWLKFHNTSTRDGLNIYLLGDPSNEKKKTSDYTSFSVIGLGANQNMYKLDMVRDRMNLRERWEAYLYLHRKWKPLKSGYEKYGMQADIDYFKEQMNLINYHFDIIPLGGQIAKNDRIKRMIPIYEQGKFWLPETCHKTNYQGVTQDLVQIFIEEEYKAFPVPVHDDMLDSDARILDEDMLIVWPGEDDIDYSGFIRKQGVFG